MVEVSSSQHWLAEVSLCSVTNLHNATLSCFPASQDTFHVSHCAALAVLCAIYSDVIRHGFFFLFFNLFWSRLFQVFSMHVHMPIHFRCLAFVIYPLAILTYPLEGNGGLEPFPAVLFVGFIWLFDGDEVQNGGIHTV